jgi:hypothetical protein
VNRACQKEEKTGDDGFPMEVLLLGLAAIVGIFLPLHKILTDPMAARALRCPMTFKGNRALAFERPSAYICLDLNYGI